MTPRALVEVGKDIHAWKVAHGFYIARRARLGTGRGALPEMFVERAGRRRGFEVACPPFDEASAAGCAEAHQPRR